MAEYDFDRIDRNIAIGRTAESHSRDQVYEVLTSGLLDPDDTDTQLSPEDEFTYRMHIARSGGKFDNLEGFLLTMYGRSYIESPELTEIYYKDIEHRVRSIGEIALFANMSSPTGYKGVTVGYLGDTMAYPASVRRNAQRANFDNNIGLSGLTAVRLEKYQRIVRDSNGEYDPLRSVLSMTMRWHPYLAERIMLHKDLRTHVERKHMYVGKSEIQQWAEANPDWAEDIENTYNAVYAGVTNPKSDFEIPQDYDIKITHMNISNMRTFELIQETEKEFDI